MKKVLKSRIFIVIITMIICISGTLYATTKYQASDVLYNGSDGTSMNVNEALNEIYNIKILGDATESDIAEGKTAVVQGKLITGTTLINPSEASLVATHSGGGANSISGSKTFDCTSIAGYDKLTENNFIVEIISTFFGNYAGTNAGYWEKFLGTTKKYNADTGILEISWSFTSYGFVISNQNFRTDISFNVYVIQ